MKEPNVFRNNAEMMAYLRGKAKKLEPLNIRDAKKDAEIDENKPKKTRKRAKKEKNDVVQTE